MIKPVIMHTAICDGCGKDVFDGTPFSNGDIELVELEMNCSDWQEIEGSHYCPNCYTLNDSDEFEPIKKETK